MLLKTRNNSKRPDVESIFKYISNKNVNNYTISDIGKVLDDLKSKGKSENKPTKKGMNSFFVVSDQLCVEDKKGIFKFWILERQGKGYASWYLSGNPQVKKC